VVPRLNATANQLVKKKMLTDLEEVQISVRMPKNRWLASASKPEGCLRTYGVR
jgi:hypothetical protein